LLQMSASLVLGCLLVIKWALVLLKDVPNILLKIPPGA
jgi:hypothetical protein